MSSKVVENWKPIKGYEGIYEVSDWGRVRSVSRVIIRKNGHSQNIKGRVLSLRKGPYYNIKLRINGVEKVHNVHALVASAFLGYIPNGHKSSVVDHIDKNPYNNHVGNLRLITHRENIMRSFDKNYKEKQRVISKTRKRKNGKYA